MTVQTVAGPRFFGAAAAFMRMVTGAWALTRDLNGMTATIGTLLAAHAAGKPLSATIEET